MCWIKNCFIINQTGNGRKAIGYWQMICMEKNRDADRKKMYILFFSAVLITLMIASLLLGAVRFSISDFLSCFIFKETTQAKNIMMYVRLPRVIGAVVSGAGIALAGAVIQVILHNPLAGPSIIGVNAGAEFAVVFLSVFFKNMFCFFPVF